MTIKPIIPTICESWDLTLPELPPRSRLYCLEPIGLGTPMVESLTGYLARLAEAHGVTLWTLYRHEIAPSLDRARFGSLCLTGSTGYQPHTINGTGALALDFSSVLESLTRRRELSHLTLLTWAAVLPRRMLLRRIRAWCPDCLNSWRAVDEPIYEPLLWTLQSVNVCPRHRRLLSFVCPSCQLQNGPMDFRLQPGHCSRCLQWLAPENTSEGQFTCTEWQLWVVNKFGELLAANSRISSKPMLETLKQALTITLSRLSIAEISILISLLQTCRPSFKLWQTGAKLPGLHFLLKICYSLDLPLLNLVCGKEPNAPVRIARSTPEMFPTESKRRRSYTLRNPKEFEDALRAALEEEPPVPVKQVIARLGFKSSNMSRRFPELRAAVAKRYADYRKSLLAKRREEAVLEVQRVAQEVHHAGIPLRYRQLFPRLTMLSITHK
jgi:TniQ